MSAVKWWGVSYTDSVANPTTGIPTIAAFLWRKGQMINLGNFGGTLSGIAEMNNRGQVIGTSSLPGDELFDPFFWNDGKLVDLYSETVGANVYTANAINDAEQVVGAGAFSDHPYDAYVWKGGVAKDLGFLDGDCYSEAFAINSKGQITGQSYSCDASNARAFLWQNGTMFELNQLISGNTDFKFTQAFVINDRGEIGGIGTPPGCDFDEDCGHALVLIPCGPDRLDRGREQAVQIAAITSDINVSPTRRASVGTSVNVTGRDLALRLQSRFGRNRSFGLPHLK